MSHAEILPTTEQPPLPESTPEPIVTYLNRDAVIDSAILRFAQNARRERTPSQHEQQTLAKATTYKRPGAMEQFVARNEGLTATLAYPFSTGDTALDTELLTSAAMALVAAGHTYTREQPKVSFVNFAAPLIQGELAENAPWIDARHYIISPGKEPTAALYQFLSTVTVAREPSDHAEIAERRSTGIFEQLVQKHHAVLQYIHLSNDEIKQRKVSLDSLYDALKDFSDTCGLNRASLALACESKGIRFIDERKPPEDVAFSPTEKMIAPHLHKVFVEAAEELGVDVRVFNKVSSSLRKKLGARSRAELVLMVRSIEASAEPPEEIHPVLEPFTPYERKVLPYIHLDTPEIMEILSISRDGVHGAIARANERMGTSNRRELAVALRQAGLELSINTPPRPLHELFDSNQLAFISDLHLPSEEIAKKHDMPLNRVGGTIHWFRKKSGARTRTELLLMAQQFDTGERREPDTRTKQEKLADKLGWSALDLDRLHKELESTSYRQRVLITSYYLSGEEVTWRTVAEEHNLGRTLAIVTARAGVLRIKKRLEEDVA